MSFPAHSRTYYSDSGYSTGIPTSSTDSSRRSLWTLKAAMKKEVLATHRGSVVGWTCASSSDGVTANNAGTDLWGTSAYDSTKIVFATAGTAHSWMVLANTTIGVWLIIDCQQQAFPTITLAFTAPGSGSITAAPTSTTGVAIGIESGWPDTPSTGYIGQILWGITSNADGGFIFFGRQVGAGGVFNIGPVLAVWEVINLKSGDTKPYVAWANRTGNNYDGTVTNQWRTGSMKGRNATNSANLTFNPLYLSTWGNAGTGQSFFGSTYTGPHTLTGLHEFVPLFIGSTSSVTIKGKLADIYQGCTANFGDGRISPTNGSPQFLSMGITWVPFTSEPLL